VKDKANTKLKLKYPDLEFVTYTKAKERAIVKNILCGHTWGVTPDGLLSLGRNSICRTCNPVKRTKRVDFSEYTTFDVVQYTGAKEPIKIKFKECGHERSVSSNALKYVRCLECRTKGMAKAKTHSEYIEEVAAKHPNINVLGEYVRAVDPIDIQFKDCLHTLSITSSRLTQNFSGICSVCNPKGSGPEIEIGRFISKYTNCSFNNRELIKPKEIDIVAEDKKLCIEYNGAYWHREEVKGKQYHLDKLNSCNNIGYSLIQITEEEWLDKQDIVKSRLRGILGFNSRLYARQTKVQEIEYPYEFLNTNHIQGAGSPTKYNYGLFLDDWLVGVMSFSRPRFSKDADFELVRYCSVLDINIVGGASKLLKAFRDKNSGSILSYSDKRWSSGNLYNVLGFEFSHSSSPGYSYYKGSKKLSRYVCQKHKLKDLFPDIYEDSKTEKQIMDEAGYYAVYDCGTDVWLLK
jgi:hypothetical protein